MYFCLCCGYETLYEKPPGTYFVCPICFWTDVEQDSWTIFELRKAQLNYLHQGASDKQWLAQVRRPTKQDHRHPQWKLLDTKIREDGTKVNNLIITAFNDVQREDGISLHEADLISKIDDHFFGYDSSRDRQLLAEARAKDVETHWKEISAHTLEKFWLSTISFRLDHKGWKYYLPAYLVWSLNKYIYNHWPDECFIDVVDNFLLKDTHYPLNYEIEDFERFSRDEYLATLFSQQLSAICQFLRFGLTYECIDEVSQKKIKNFIQDYDPNLNSS
ncbi:DUF6714 family protein [Crocosphaera chwakensis]|uniref:Cysteine-rich CPCC domain-containing protein n=1 Tax=Crocosphaera chwakensis CCY0110 TaxID=391612 RepID=A3IK06_9CHRO|nr:DUF6714 family protein [Crocosphaera chwakensis]EAZ92995.1 hypothetical protein CY0110_02964 [Crocosphaera chwakensis CCY0110]